MMDGRNQRSAETKARILAAGRAMMLAGNFRPSVAAIADKALVSVRSVFTHFDSVEKLHATLLDDELLRVDIWTQVMTASAPCDVDRVVHAAVYGRPWA